MKLFFLSWLRSVTLSQIWTFFFLYSVVVALLLQLVVLPYLFTGLHAGEGLLAGGDWVGFHQIAVEMADKIREQGWSAWKLRPKYQAPSGIAAALYAVTVPHPWVLVPLNAALHATTGVVLVRIMQSFVPDLRHALICVLPFMLFPSAMTWYAQIHKEGYYFAGMFLCLYGWILVARLETWQGRITQALPGLVWIFAGCLLIWIVRPYGIKLMQGMGVIFAMFLVPLFLVRGMRRRLPAPRVVLSVLIVLVLPPALGVYKDGRAAGEVTVVTQDMLTEAFQRERGGAATADVFAQKAAVGAFAQKAAVFQRSVQWQRTEWLPITMDQIFFTLAMVRAGYAGSTGMSNIDVGVVFHSAREFIPYLPRALQIGFAAPFPTQWIAQGSSEGGSAMRRISSLEMMVVYSALLFLPYALWRWRSKIETWLILSFCAILLLIYTYIIPNVGSLYRARYGFLMMLVALGIAGGMAAWQRMRPQNSA